MRSRWRALRGGMRWTGQLVLDVSAGLWAPRGGWERAGRFHGASEGQLKEMGLQRCPVDESGVHGSR